MKKKPAHFVLLNFKCSTSSTRTKRLNGASIGRSSRDSVLTYDATGPTGRTRTNTRKLAQWKVKMFNNRLHWVPINVFLLR